MILEKEISENLAILEPPTLGQTVLSGKVIDANTAKINYTCLPDNLPNTYGNSLSIWQNVGIPYGQKPITQEKIKNNTPNGDQTFSNLKLQSLPYVVAYSTSTEPNSYVATVQFNPGGQDGKPFLSSLSLVEVGVNSVVIGFVTPTGNVPKNNKNWVGLWQGPTATFNGSNMLTWKPVDRTTNEASITIDYKLQFNTVYTVAYGLSKAASSIGMTLTFKTPPF